MGHSVILFGRRLDIHRNLSPDEYSHVKDNLNLFKFLELGLLGRTEVTKGRLSGTDRDSDIWIVKKGNDAYLSYPQGFEKDLSRDR